MGFKLLKSEKRNPYYTESIKTTDTLDAQDYCAVVKRVKKENITKENISNIMLCQIPGISDITANAIFQKFKTITELIITIKQDPACLDDVKTIMSNGKSRKISKSSIQSILDFLKD
jgi:ERCC4-type nuclease